MITAVAVMAAAGQGQVWSEQFEGGPRVNGAVWTHDLGAHGWGNKELQTYTNDPANVRVEDGMLIITARETVEDGTSGLLVKPGDGEALASAVHRLATDHELRREMGRAAAERGKLYSGADHGTRVAELYEALATEAAR